MAGLLARIAAIATAGAALVLPMDVAGAAQSDPKSLDDLIAVYGVGDVPADVLTVVDTSTSMKDDGTPPPWPYVQRGWADLVNAVRPQDRVGLVTFDRAAATRLPLGPLPDKAARAEAKAQLPESPQGTATDIGAGLQAAVERLEAPGASQIQTLIFITDGVHHPGPNSSYPKRSGPAWEALKKEGKALTESRGGRLSVYGWAAGSDQTDIDLLQSVFPKAEIVDLPPSRIGPFLQSAVLGLQRERVRPLVHADLDLPIQAHFDPEGTLPLQPEMKVSLVLRNDRKGLRTTVDLKSLTLTESDGTPVPVEFTPDRVTIAPGSQVEVPVTIRPAGASHRPEPGNHVDSRQWQVKLDAPTSLSPALTDLLTVELLATAKSTRGEAAIASPVSASDSYGIAWSYVIGGAILLALLLLGLLLFLKWFFIAPGMVGVLVRKTDDNEWTQVKRLRGKSLDIPGNWLVGVEGDHACRLYTKPRAKPGSVYVAGTAGQPRLNDQVLTRHPRLLAGKMDLKLGDVVLRYEKRPVGK